MAEQTRTVTHISELLNEEKWTRAALNSYTVKNFQELDRVVEGIMEQENQEEALEACEEHLQHTKNSIIALYISGIINLNRQVVDDSNLVTLIQIFSDNHKWSIVEYLAERILDFGENKFALRTLAETYAHESREENLYEIWERLIRVDYEEADIVRKLALRKEEEGETEEAVNYYKKALHRYINQKLFTSVKEVWHRLIQLAPEETEFFYHAEGKIAKTISPDRAVQLLEDLYPYFKQQERWDTAIEILKRVLAYDAKNPWARKEIVECFQAKYSDHSHLDDYIRLSNLNQGWRNVHDSIADFEKHIAFDKGNFVFHRSWGVGRIRDIQGDTIVIDFAKKRNHKMSLKMAVSALDVLAKDHIWVLRSVWPREKLKLRVKKNPTWALKTVIRSLDNAADMKKIKAELVPQVLTQGEWSSWSTKARSILKTSEDFGTLQAKLDHFVVRDQPITFEEKTFNKFKAEKDFFDRVATFREFLDHIEENASAGTDSDFFREMFEYFVAFLRNPAQVNEQVISSQLLVSDVLKIYPYLAQEGLHLDFEELYNEIEDLESTFAAMDSNEIKREFLHAVRRSDKNWPAVYIRLFPYVLSRDVVHELERAGHEEMLKDLFKYVYQNYRELREPFIWFTRNCEGDDWFRNVDVDYEKILIGTIHIYDLTFRDIENRKDATTNRKINKQAQSYLFKEGHLSRFLETADQDSVTRIYTLLSDVKDIDSKLLIETRQQVLDRFPDFKFYGEREEAVESSVSRGFYAAPGSYDRKQRELTHLHEVEVPENSKEIDRARSYGDLRENAEYKAALEHQAELNRRAGELKSDLERVRIVNPKEVTAERVAFGTKVTLQDLDKGTEVVYTILGPWESDPDKGIINYQSPLGKKLYNQKPGDELTFEINERTYHYRIERIEVASFA
ncbi:MAG: transcription elongation factor GreA [Spirochaetaceae bacterium]